MRSLKNRVEVEVAVQLAKGEAEMKSSQLQTRVNVRWGSGVALLNLVALMVLLFSGSQAMALRPSDEPKEKAIYQDVKADGKWKRVKFDRIDQFDIAPKTLETGQAKDWLSQFVGKKGRGDFKGNQFLAMAESFVQTALDIIKEKSGGRGLENARAELKSLYKEVIKLESPNDPQKEKETFGVHAVKRDGKWEFVNNFYGIDAMLKRIAETDPEKLEELLKDDRVDSDKLSEFLEELLMSDSDEAKELRSKLGIATKKKDESARPSPGAGEGDDTGKTDKDGETGKTGKGDGKGDETGKTKGEEKGSEEGPAKTPPAPTGGGEQPAPPTAAGPCPVGAQAGFNPMDALLRAIQDIGNRGGQVAQPNNLAQELLAAARNNDDDGNKGAQVTPPASQNQLPLASNTPQPRPNEGFNEQPSTTPAPPPEQQSVRPRTPPTLTEMPDRKLKYEGADLSTAKALAADLTTDTSKLNSQISDADTLLASTKANPKGCYLPNGNFAIQLCLGVLQTATYEAARLKEVAKQFESKANSNLEMAKAEALKLEEMKKAKLSDEDQKLYARLKKEAKLYEDDAKASAERAGSNSQVLGLDQDAAIARSVAQRAKDNLAEFEEKMGIDGGEADEGIKKAKTFVTTLLTSAKEFADKASSLKSKATSFEQNGTQAEALTFQSVNPGTMASGTKTVGSILGNRNASSNGRGSRGTGLGAAQGTMNNNLVNGTGPQIRGKLGPQSNGQSPQNI